MKNDIKNIQAGQAALLIILLITVIFKQAWLLPWSIAFLIILMVVPKVMTPFAKLWFLFSEKLGALMSKVILSVLFYLLVCPMSFCRKLYGADPMQLKKWKKSKESVFVHCEKAFTQHDLEKPY